MFCMWIVTSTALCCGFTWCICFHSLPSSLISMPKLMLQNKTRNRNELFLETTPWMNVLLFFTLEVRNGWVWINTVSVHGWTVLIVLKWWYTSAKKADSIQYLQTTLWTFWFLFELTAIFVTKMRNNDLCFWKYMVLSVWKWKSRERIARLAFTFR